MSTVATTEIELTPERDTRPRASVRSRLQDALPIVQRRLRCVIIFVYGFII